MSLFIYLFQGLLDAIDVDKAVQYVLSCMNFDGGFGCRPGSESHSGQVCKVWIFQTKVHYLIQTICATFGIHE